MKKMKTTASRRKLCWKERGCSRGSRQGSSRKSTEEGNNSKQVSRKQQQEFGRPVQSTAGSSRSSVDRSGRPTCTTCTRGEDRSTARSTDWKCLTLS